MVAPRGRVAALWLVTLMTSSTLVALVPSAVAMHEPTASNRTIEIFKNGAWEAYNGADTIKLNDQVRFGWTVSWPQTDCDTGGDGTVDPSVGDSWVLSADAVNVGAHALGAAVVSIPSATWVNTSTATTVTYRFVTPAITAAAPVVGTNGEDLAASVRLFYNVTCAPVPLVSVPTPKDPDDFASTTFKVDTVKPVLATPVITLTHDCTLKACNGLTPVTGSASFASLGSTLAFTPLREKTGDVLEVNLGALITGATWGPATHNVAISRVVKAPGTTEATGQTWGTHTGSGTAPALKLRATDVAGNLGDEVTINWNSQNVDNVVPNPSKFQIESGTLARTPSAASVTLDWSGETEPAFARGSVTGASTCLLGYWAGTATFTVPSSCAPSPLETELNVTLLPVDAAGNINTAYTPVVSPPFPRGVTVEYGGQPQARPIKDNEFGNVYVNVTENGPILPYPTQRLPQDLVLGDLRVYGELRRDFANLTGMQGPPSQLATPDYFYWRAGTSTSNLASDFQKRSQADPALTSRAGDDSHTTVFRPPHTASGQGAYVLGNLSGKTLSEGRYQLIVTLAGAIDKDFTVVFTRGIVIDKTAPNNAAHRNYTGQAGPGQGPGPNSTQAAEIHGMDNNPLRVLVQATDWAVATHGASTSVTTSRKDAGLRNLTVELVDAATEQVALRTTNGQPARVSITPTSCAAPGTADRSPFALSYCLRVPELSASPPSEASCNTKTGIGVNDSQNSTSCAWNEIVRKGRWNTTFVNTTQFAGWVNVTWPDLAAGKYKIRVSIWDNADREKALQYGGGPTATDNYKVGPAVSMVTNTQSPIITDSGKLRITPLASQRFVTPPTGRPCSTAAADTCAADRVLVYLSNTNGANDQGIQYGDAITNISALDETNPASPLQVRGWTLKNPWNGSMALANDFPIRLFPFSQGPEENLPVIPATIDLAQPVYVRVAALAVNGTGDEMVRSVTDWVPVVSLAQPAVQVRQPAVDFALNVTSQFDTSHATPDKPFGPRFNLTFNRKVDLAKPILDYTVTPLNDSANVLTSVTGMDPNLTGSAQPRVVFNWSGWLKPAGDANYPAGVYHFHAKIKQSAADTTPLAEIRRNFTILQDAPAMWINASNLTVGIAKRDITYYVLPNFEVPFKVNHSFANLTSVEQIELKLLRGSVSPGQTPVLTKGQEGFDYTLLAAPILHESFLSSNFTANITMPPGVPTGSLFQLQIIAHLDTPPHELPSVNATATLALRIDKQAPAAALRTPESESTVFVTGSSPPRNKASSDPLRAPGFRGFTEDFGSGPSRVEVRIYDVTLNKTIRISNTTFQLVDGLSEQPSDWATSDDNGGVRGYTSSGTKVPFSSLTGTSKEWIVDVSAFEVTDPGGIFNTSHKYRVDVRAMDALGNWSSVNTTLFDFDAAPPTLGYLGALGSGANLRSGLNATAARVAWHGNLRISVNVTDNDCLAAVRLKGTSDLAPTVNLTGNMTRVGGGGASYVCYEQMPRNTLPSGTGTNFAEYEVDLGNYPNFTDHVANYTLWWEAEDAAGQVSTIPTSFRNFRLDVLDNSPATVRSVTVDPSPGQAGGRALVRADVFDNHRISHVTIRVSNASTNALVASGLMRPDNATDRGIGRYVADTQTDLNLTLQTGDYVLNVTAYDVNWNRSVDPTCPIGWCLGIPSYIYRVRDDGPPAVVLESPSDNSTVNATPVFKLRALGKNVQTSGITLVAGVEGAQAAIPAANLSFTELTATNGTRQGYAVAYAPGTLPDNATFTLNVSVSVSGVAATGSYRFRVDALPPTATANVSRTESLAGKTWIVADTSIAITASDNVSATTVKYKVNNGQEQTYAGPIDPSGADGDWRLEYWAVDAVGNAAVHQNLTLSLDGNGPRISVAQHGDEVLLTVSDAGVGLNESSVVVHYRYGEAVSFSTVNAEKVVGNSYRALLPGNATASGLAYYFTALDLLGQTGSNYSAAQPYTIRAQGGGDGGEGGTNLPPTVRILQPLTGAQVRGALELRWAAADPEEAPLTISIAVRDPPPGRVLVPAGENSGSYIFNLSGLAAGAYTLVVTANDGENSASSQVTFNVITDPPVNCINCPPAQVDEGTPVTVAIDIEPVDKTVAQVTYRLVKDGQTVATNKMAPSGGAYTASFVPPGAGDYRVVVDVAYTDGTTEPSRQVATFTVPGETDEGGARVFPPGLMTLVAIAILTVALAAYGAFGRWKK